MWPNPVSCVLPVLTVAWCHWPGPGMTSAMQQAFFNPNFAAETVGWVRILKPFERKVVDNFASRSDLSVISALLSLAPRLCQFTVPICLPRPLCVTHESWLITEKLVGQIPPGEVSCSCDIMPGPPDSAGIFSKCTNQSPCPSPSHGRCYTGIWH